MVERAKSFLKSNNNYEDVILPTILTINLVALGVEVLSDEFHTNQVIVTCVAILLSTINITYNKVDLTILKDDDKFITRTLALTSLIITGMSLFV